MEINKKKLGLVIKGIRKRLKLTQEDLKDELGLSVNYLSQLETGRRGIGLDNLNKVANFYQVPAEVMLILAADTNEDDQSDIGKLQNEIQDTARIVVDFLVSSRDSAN